MMPLLLEELPYDPNQVTPGWIGFTATALVAIVIMALMWDFNRRVRRISDRAEAKERIEAELAEQRAAEASDAPAGHRADGADGRADDAPPRTP